MQTDKAFINDDFLLTTPAARRLYHQYAAAQPIIDYHCHLPPTDIMDNRQFRNLFEIWLEGDHYKWRAMRANGVPEEYCTGDASAFDKFLAWAKTVPCTLRNPLYHWTHLELARYFGIHELLNEKNAKSIWKRTEELLRMPALSAHGILKKFRVIALCTTDDPTDDLSQHQAIAASDLDTEVYPCFRPDNAMNLSDLEAFNQWTDKLAQAADVEVVQLKDFLEALQQRHQYFHQQGCRLSDHGIEYCFAGRHSEKEASRVFEKARAGQAVDKEEREVFSAFMMMFFGRLDAERGWTKQLHLGALRNANTRRFAELGPNTGFDSIGDWPQARALNIYLDSLDRENALPKTIIYNLNPADNYLIASLIGNFQNGSVPGKIQFGSGWWFLDQKEGMEWQINALSNNGLLSRFVGMLTDSRSFMSFPRHEYFRRILCNLLGREMESGEIPNDEDLVGPMVKDICYRNAQRYLGFPEKGVAGKTGKEAVAPKPVQASASARK